MHPLRAGALAAVACVLLGVAPAARPHAAPRLAAVPRDARTQIVTRYLAALRHADYATAYALLSTGESRYFRNARNLQSVYDADAFHLQRATLLGVRGLRDPAGSVYLARETAGFREHGNDLALSVTATVPIGVVHERAGWRIVEPGRPWRAFACGASASAGGLRVTVKKVSFFARRVELVVRFVNTSPGFVTTLPYGRSILRDQTGAIYRPIETRDPRLTDRTLFTGLRLASQAAYTGALTFETPPLDDRDRRFTLTLGPVLADGADLPFAIDVADIARPAP